MVERNSIVPSGVSVGIIIVVDDCTTTTVVGPSDNNERGGNRDAVVGARGTTFWFKSVITRFIGFADVSIINVCEVGG